MLPFFSLIGLGALYAANIWSSLVCISFSLHYLGDWSNMSESCGCFWSEEATTLLLQLWADAEVQRKLESCHRNMHIFDSLAEQLTAKGYPLTGLQCQTRIKTLKKDYRRVESHNKKSGSNRKTCPYFELLHPVMKDKPSTCPKVHIESASTPVVISSGPSTEGEGEYLLFRFVVHICVT